MFHQVIMKMIAFTPYGYLQSKRHRADFFITIFGVVWIVLNYVLENEYTLTLGYVVIILRFVNNNFQVNINNNQKQ